MVADNDFTAIATLCAVPLRRTCVSAPAVVPGRCRRRLARELPGTLQRPEYIGTWGCFGSRRSEVTGVRCGEKQTARPVADLYTARYPPRRHRAALRSGGPRVPWGKRNRSRSKREMPGDADD